MMTAGEIMAAAAGNGTESTRRRLLQGVALAGAGSALGIALRQRWPEALAQAQAGDAFDLLNLGLLGEVQQGAVYQACLAGRGLDDRDRAFVEPMLAKTQYNAGLLRQVIREQGAEPIEDPAFTMPAEEFDDRERALRLALEQENLGTGAWIGSQSASTDPVVQGLIITLFTCMARRAATLGVLLGDPAAPFAGAVEAGIPLPEVLEAIERFRGAAQEGSG